MNTDNKYTEHEKLKSVQQESQFLGEFLDWMGENGYFICKQEEAENYSNHFITVQQHKSIEQWLSMFLNIDLKKIEVEKQQMLKEIREMNK